MAEISENTPEDLANMYLMMKEQYISMYSNSNIGKQPAESLSAVDLLSTEDEQEETEPRQRTSGRRQESRQATSSTPTTSGY